METTKICEHLASIYKLEIEHGNEIISIQIEVWEKINYEICLGGPLHEKLISEQIEIPKCVRSYENHDSHYTLGTMYVCDECKHAIQGLLWEEKE